MLRGIFVCLLIGSSVLWAQQESSAPNSDKSSSSTNAGSPTSGDKKATQAPKTTKAPNLAPPRSDHVDAGALGESGGESSSKDTQIDLSPPENDARQHPESSDAVSEAEEAAGGGSSVGEFHPWDPHKAAKSVEVGDYYFKRKNYRAAEDRYREALFYKDNDAEATYRLAVCLEKLGRPDEARAEYESYLRILPHGALAGESQKSLARLKAATAKSESQPQ